MKIEANNIRAGNVLEHQGDLWVVSKTPQHTQPGKGGAFVQVEMKNLKTGVKLNERFRSNDDVERVRLDQKDHQYLFHDDQWVTLMDTETYEQIPIPCHMFGSNGDDVPFLRDGLVLIVEFYGETPVAVHFPDNMVWRIAQADAVIRGQTATSSYKPAVLENGVRVMVPPFVESGDNIVVKIEDRTYMKRADG
jgi:elongation factor P